MYHRQFTVRLGCIVLSVLLATGVLAGCQPQSVAISAENQENNASMTPDVVLPGRIVFRDTGSNISAINRNGMDDSIEITGLDPSVRGWEFSVDHQKLAYWCSTDEEREKGMFIICVADLQGVNRPVDIRLLAKRITVMVAPENTRDPEDMQISWSPDGEHLLVDNALSAHVYNVPCVIDVEKETADCGETNLLMAGFLDADLEILRNDSVDPRSSLQWSPADPNLLAFVIDHKGLFLVDLSLKQIIQIYGADIPSAPLMPTPVWSPDGRYIALSYEILNEPSSEYSIEAHPIIDVVALEDADEARMVLDGLDLYFENIPDHLPVIPEFWTNESPFYLIATHDWSPDGKYLLFSALIDNLHGMQGGLFALDVQTGRVWVVKRYEKGEINLNTAWIP